MQENEVIIVDGINPSDYEAMVLESVQYAIISLPFTVNRMDIDSVKGRVLNIAKGKLAESLFKFFCEANHIHTDFDACSTPFWTVDKRDFILNGNEWDIKNNFYYCIGNEYNGYYTHFPALVPNRSNYDQWAKRNMNINVGTGGVEFVFTFLKGADLVGGNRGQEFLEIVLAPDQLQFIVDLWNKYKGIPLSASPFSEDDFWSKFRALGNQDELFTLRFRPHLVITGYANSTHWHLFQTTGPNDRRQTFMNALYPHWYRKFRSGTLSFLNGTLWTTIDNETCMVSECPSFLSLFPRLKDEIKLGHIKQ